MSAVPQYHVVKLLDENENTMNESTLESPHSFKIAKCYSGEKEEDADDLIEESNEGINLLKAFSLGMFLSVESEQFFSKNLPV